LSYRCIIRAIRTTSGVEKASWCPSSCKETGKFKILF